MDREQVRLELRERSRAAWKAFAGAARRFDEAKRAVPHGIPLPDEARIAASREYTRALQVHREAGKLAYEFALGQKARSSARITGDSG